MEELEYRLVRSSRKTVSIQITPGGEIVVRCPRLMSSWAVRSLVRSREDWIRQQLAKRKPAEAAQPLTEEEQRALAKTARDWFSRRAA